mmetsp:Transcript_26097/g.55061  ORF Transcript_26097/g.55061 Transcript_26097/m.55061 type:complete len:174 (-) Transcript_26097:962-1483(-)
MEVPCLQTLCFGNNHIRNVPADLIAQCFSSLTTLEGQNNRLQSFPDLFDCKRLTVVDLSDNALEILPAINASVVRYNLNNNSLSLMEGLFSGAQQRQIQQQSSDKTTFFRSNLTELRLRGNKLSSLDEDIVRCLIDVSLLDVGQTGRTNVREWRGRRSVRQGRDTTSSSVHEP